VHEQWQALESFEAITQDDVTRDLFLRMAHLSRSGRLAPFIAELAHDQGLDPETSAAFTELACDGDFLQAFEEYVHRTRDLH
jgi:hypothetical protein